MYRSTERLRLLSEVRHVMKQLRNGKAPGCDDLPAELLKASGDEGICLMSQLYVGKSGKQGNGQLTVVGCVCTFTKER